MSRRPLSSGRAGRPFQPRRPFCIQHTVAQRRRHPTKKVYPILRNSNTHSPTSQGFAGDSFRGCDDLRFRPFSSSVAQADGGGAGPLLVQRRSAAARRFVGIRRVGSSATVEGELFSPSMADYLCSRAAEACLLDATEADLIAPLCFVQDEHPSTATAPDPIACSTFRLPSPTTRACWNDNILASFHSQGEALRLVN